MRDCQLKPPSASLQPLLPQPSRPSPSEHLPTRVSITHQLELPGRPSNNRRPGFPNNLPPAESRGTQNCSRTFLLPILCASTIYCWNRLPPEDLPTTRSQLQVLSFP